MKQIRIQRKRTTQRQRDIANEPETTTTTTTHTGPDLSAADELLRRIDELVADA